MTYDDWKNETPPIGKPIEEPEIVCTLCGEPCTGDFQCIRETIVCGWCMKNCENLTESINFIKSNHGNLQETSAGQGDH